MSELKTPKSLSKLIGSIADKVLCSSGFTKKRGNFYIRHTEDQLHGVDFQISGSNRTYSINIGFQYDFIPNIYSFFQPGIESHEFMGADQLILNTRLSMLEQGVDIWNSYNVEFDAVSHDIESIQNRVISTFDERHPEWRDPNSFLSKISIEFLTTLSIKRTGFSDLRKLLYGFDANPLHLCYFLIRLAIISGDVARARNIASIAQDLLPRNARASGFYRDALAWALK